MKSRNKLTMCRLCLCENECFINVFELNDWQSYIAAEVIFDLLKLQVSENDGYPHVVCSKCLVKLSDFKLFKECCQNSKVKYDNMFLDEHQPEMLEFVTVKAEPIFHSDDEDNASKATIKTEEEIIYSSFEEATVEPFKETETEMSCGPILLKYEVLPFGRDSHTQDEVTVSQTSDYLSATDHSLSSNAEGITSDLTTSEINIKEEPSEVQATLLGTGTHPQYLRSLEHKGAHCASKGADRADSCTRNISIYDESKFEMSKNISSSSEVEASSSNKMERSEGKCIHRGEIMCMTSHIQENAGIGKEGKKGWGREEKRKGGRRTALEKRGEGKVERFECHHCGNLLLTKRGLVTHMKMHGFGNSYDCDICGKRFPSKGNLKNHVVTHTGSKAYKCVECFKCFTQNGSLKVHMRSHTGSKPYKCSECSKSYIQNSHLIIHMRTHTGFKPYKCAECDKSYIQSSHLKSHMRTHTGCKPYKCIECCKCFSQMGHLKSHLRTHRLNTT